MKAGIRIDHTIWPVGQGGDRLGTSHVHISTKSKGGTHRWPSARKRRDSMLTPLREAYVLNTFSILVVFLTYYGADQSNRGGVQSVVCLLSPCARERPLATAQQPHSDNHSQPTTKQTPQAPDPPTDRIIRNHTHRHTQSAARRTLNSVSSPVWSLTRSVMVPSLPASGFTSAILACWVRSCLAGTVEVVGWRFPALLVGWLVDGVRGAQTDG